MKKLIKPPSPSMVIALVALFVALGGASYAAIKIPKNSVGTKQLKNNAVTTQKIKNAAVDGAKLKDGAVTLGKVNAGARIDLRGALAYAQVNALNPSLVEQRTSGFTSIRGQSPGVYCLTLAPAVASRFFDNEGQPVRAPVASVEFGNTILVGPATPVVMVRGASIACQDFELEVHTQVPYGTPAQDISFNVVIP